MAVKETAWTNEAIISDALGRAADLEIGSTGDGWRLSRWRQFVGSYQLPALPDPTFVVHIAGKPRVKTWERGSWSETSSIPGCATILPAGRRTDAADPGRALRAADRRATGLCRCAGRRTEGAYGARTAGRRGDEDPDERFRRLSPASHHEPGPRPPRGRSQPGDDGRRRRSPA
jgi:hypothetical protein